MSKIRNSPFMLCQNNVVLDFQLPFGMKNATVHEYVFTLFRHLYLANRLLK